MIIKLVSSGFVGLDAALSGGLGMSQSFLFLGPPGSGKTTLARVFLHSVLKDGKAALYCTTRTPTEFIPGEMALVGLDISGYEQNLHIVELRRREPGIAVKGGNVTSASPSDLNDALGTITRSIAAFKPALLVFDSVSDLFLSNDEAAVYKFMQRLASLVAKNELAGVFLLEGGLHPDRAVQTIDYLADNSLELAFSESRRMMRVRKLKTRGHDLGWIPFTLKTTVDSNIVEFFQPMGGR